MATQQVGGITNNDITSAEQDLFYAAVEEKVDVEESSLPAFAFARVKEEPVDYDEMSTQDDAFLGNADILLPAIEEVLVDPPPVKTEPNNEDIWRYTQPDSPEQIDPLLLPEEVKQEPKPELPFAGSVTTQGQTVTKSSTTQGRTVTRSSTAQGHMVASHSNTHGRTVPGSSTAQGHKVPLHAKTQGQKMTGVACKECGKMFLTGRLAKQHSLSHSGKKVHACAECDYRTAYSSHLRRHAKRHVGEGPHACAESECDYRTSRRCDLEAHLLRTHARETPCRTATEDGNLPPRVTSHAREKPHALAERGRRTATEDGNLPSRVRMHTIGRNAPYPWTQFDYRSVVMSSLAAHKMIAQGLH